MHASLRLSYTWRWLRSTPRWLLRGCVQVPVDQQQQLAAAAVAARRPSAELRPPAAQQLQLQQQQPGSLKFVDRDEHVYFWFPLLAGLSELTFDPRPEIRRSALEVSLAAAAAGCSFEGKPSGRRACSPVWACVPSASRMLV